MEGPDSDDWLFDSVRRYSSLYMYDLQQPVTAADWCGSDSLCIAVSDKRRHEILELSLPSQILADKENVALVKDRDFQVVNGGFCDTKVTSVRHIPQSRCVVTTEAGVNAVSVWQLGGEPSNIIKRIGRVQNRNQDTVSCPAVVKLLSHCETWRALFCSCLNNICIADLSAHKITEHTACEEDTPISNMIVYDSNLVVMCDKNSPGLFLLDVREKNLISSKYMAGITESNASVWTLGEMMQSAHEQSSEESRDSQIFQVSDTGIVIKKDIRNLSQNILKIQTGLQTYHDQMNDTPVNFQCSSNGKFLSLSGFDGKVYLYHHEIWKDGEKQESVFIHEGHISNSDSKAKIVTTTHMWYPWKPLLLLSTASDGSVHTWEPTFSL